MRAKISVLDEAGNVLEGEAILVPAANRSTDLNGVSAGARDASVASHLQVNVDVPQRAAVGGDFTPPAAPTGPSAGIRILVAQRFFESKRSLGDVRSALVERGYHYSAQAIDMALKRLSRRDGLLVSLREGRRKTYVERK